MAVSLLAFGLRRSHLWECYPRGSHISRLLTGGSLGFRIVLLLLPFFFMASAKSLRTSNRSKKMNCNCYASALVPSWLTDCCMAFSLFVVCSCFILPYQSSLLIRFRWLWIDQLITGRAVFALCLVLCYLGCVGFVFLLLCGFCLFILHWFDVIAR